MQMVRAATGVDDFSDVDDTIIKFFVEVPVKLFSVTFFIVVV